MNVGHDGRHKVERIIHLKIAVRALHYTHPTLLKASQADLYGPNYSYYSRSMTSYTHFQRIISRTPTKDFTIHYRQI